MGKNLKMSDDVYALRRRVIEHVYDAKNLLRKHGVELPRIEVRVTDNTGECGSALGMGRMGCNIIWISTKCLNIWKLHLKEVVFHEILHAVKAVKHDDSCPLMSPCVGHQPLTDDVLNQNFIKYFDKK